MNRKGYTVLGWLVWNLATSLAKIKMSQNRGKIGAGAVIALVLVGGVVAAKASGDE